MWRGIFSMSFAAVADSAVAADPSSLSFLEPFPAVCVIASACAPNDCLSEREMEFIIGFLIGVAIGATGVGGGTLTAPVLMLVMRYPPHIAVATALVFSASVKVWASAVYLLRRQVDFRVLGYLLWGGLPGAILGAYMLQKLHSKRSDTWLLAAVGTLIAVTAIVNLFSHRAFIPKTKSKWPLVSSLAIAIGMESGFSSAGSGALGTIMLFRLTTLAPSAVVGTDLLFGLFISGTAGIVHAMGGTCDWPALARLIPAGIVGTLIGSMAAGGMTKTALRKAILIAVTCTGVMLLIKGLSGMS
jgi:hypothetical protein